MNYEEISKKIKEIEDFTCQYWWPALADAEKNIALTPAAPAIIKDIIKTRGNYVAQLKQNLKDNWRTEYDKHFKMAQKSHSVDANGYCNMGCC